MKSVQPVYIKQTDMMLPYMRNLALMILNPNQGLGLQIMFC